MSCYLRHMDTVLKEAGVKLTAENRKEIDRIIHKIVDVSYKNCPATWREVKRRITQSEETRSRFIAQLKKATRPRKKK